MPMVNGKKYAYTKTGMAAAKKAAKKSGEKMRKVGAKGAPTAKAFKQSLRTAKKK